MVCWWWLEGSAIQLCSAIPCSCKAVHYIGVVQHDNITWCSLVFCPLPDSQPGGPGPSQFSGDSPTSSNQHNITTNYKHTNKHVILVGSRNWLKEIQNKNKKLFSLDLVDWFLEMLTFTNILKIFWLNASGEENISYYFCFKLDWLRLFCFSSSFINNDILIPPVEPTPWQTRTKRDSFLKMTRWTGTS